MRTSRNHRLAPLSKSLAPSTAACPGLLQPLVEFAVHAPEVRFFGLHASPRFERFSWFFRVCSGMKWSVGGEEMARETGRRVTLSTKEGTVRTEG